MFNCHVGPKSADFAVLAGAKASEPAAPAILAAAAAFERCAAAVAAIPGLAKVAGAAAGGGAGTGGGVFCSGIKKLMAILPLWSFAYHTK